MAKGDVPDIYVYKDGKLDHIEKGDGSIVRDSDLLDLHGGFDHTVPFEFEKVSGRFG